MWVSGFDIEKEQWTDEKADMPRGVWGCTAFVDTKRNRIVFNNEPPKKGGTDAKFEMLAYYPAKRKAEAIPVKGLKPKGLIGATFGSFGWSGEAARNIRDVLTEMDVELVGEPLRVTYVPDADVLQQCYDLGLAVAKKLSDK